MRGISMALALGHRVRFGVAPCVFLRSRHEPRPVCLVAMHGMGANIHAPRRPILISVRSARNIPRHWCNVSFSVLGAGLGPRRYSSLRRARHAASSRLVALALGHPVGQPLAAVVSMPLARRKNPSFLSVPLTTKHYTSQDGKILFSPA